MWEIGITSLWVDDNGRNRAQAFIDYAGQSLWDVSGTPASQLIPGENVVAIEGVVDDATYTAMQADGNVVIVWAEEVVDE